MFEYIYQNVIANLSVRFSMDDKKHETIENTNFKIALCIKHSIWNCSIDFFITIKKKSRATDVFPAFRVIQIVVYIAVINHSV